MPLLFSVPIEANHVGAVAHDAGHRRDRLDVVDHRRRGVQAGDGGERRAQPRLAATALERVEQRGLLAADVGAGARVHGDVEVVAGAVDVLAEVAGEVGLLDGALQPAYDVQHLAADVDERVVGADRVAGDDHALDQRVRRGHHQRDVLAGARLGLVGVDHQVVRLAVALRDEAPLHAGREARAAAAAQAGVLDQRDDVVLGHAQGGVAARRTRRCPRRTPASTGGSVSQSFDEDRGQHVDHGQEPPLGFCLPPASSPTVSAPDSSTVGLGLGPVGRRLRCRAPPARCSPGRARRDASSRRRPGRSSRSPGRSAGRPARRARRPGPRRRGRRGSRRAPARPRARCRSAGRGWSGPRRPRAGRRPAGSPTPGSGCP